MDAISLREFKKGGSSLKFFFPIVMCLWAFWSPLQADVRQWLTSRYEVTKILGGSGFTLNFNGMTVAIRLVSVNVTDPKAAGKYLEDKILHQKINVIPEESAGTSPEGLQLAYAIVEEGGEKIFINEELIKAGWATYESVESGQFSKLQAKLLESSIQQKSNQIGTVDSSKASSSNQVCSELYSKKYHLMDCRWAKLLNPQSRILYDGFEAAEKADKFPCSQCLYERVKEKRTEAAQQKRTQSEEASSAPVAETQEKTSDAESSKPLGGLIGLNNDNFFYSPVSKKCSGLKAGQFILFKTLEEAKASGRKPDPGSLRIDNPVVPGPIDKECIGRGLPYLRPCRRDSEDPSGLCEPCLNGRIK
jgi:hypothetical protein